MAGRGPYLPFRDAARTDPAKFIASLPRHKLSIIDEVQQAPEIFPFLKIAVDENRGQGRGVGLFLLTGSASLMALPQLSEALVGRMSILTLLPFSSGEYRRTGINFIEKLFVDKMEYRRYRNFNLLNVISGAGFPELALNFENFIACEIMKNAASFPDLQVSHFRTSDQKEVDFVLERGGGLIGIEAKLNSTPDNHDFSGLKLLREAAGERFKKGIVIYPGTELVPFGEDLWAVPVCYLWEG